MRTISKIIYTIIVCKFLMGVRERLMTRPSLDTTHCLLIEYIKDAKVALLFGYAKRPKQLRNLLGEMRKNGVEVCVNGHGVSSRKRNVQVYRL